MSEQSAPDPKRCPKCNRVAFRTMTDYLCVTGCGWHEHHNEPLRELRAADAEGSGR